MIKDNEKQKYLSSLPLSIFPPKKVKEKLKERVQCECCGVTVSKQYLPKHKLRESCKLKAGKLNGKTFKPKVMIEVELYDKLKKLLEKEETLIETE